MRSRRYPSPRAARHSVNIPAEIVRLQDFRLLADSIENLSEGGLLAGPSLQASPGDKLLVSFRVPRTHVWVDLDAVVARVIRGRRANDRGPRLGVQFESTTEKQLQWLQYALSHAPPAPPSSRSSRRNPAQAVRELAIGSGWTHSRFGQMLVRWWDK